MGAPVVHFEVNGKDGKKLQDFYAKLFDWSIDANNPMNYGMVNTGSEQGIQGGIGQVESDDQAWTTFYVAVPDLAKTLEQAEQMGAKTVVPPTEIPGVVTFAIFTDPEGHLIGLVKG